MLNHGPTYEASYARLRNAARRVLARRPRSLIHTTALAHETWLKLVHREDLPPFGVIVAVMRSILIDEARREGAEKRGKGWRRVALGDEAEAEGMGLDLLEVDEAMAELERVHPRAAQVLELRIFGGLGTSQTAALMRLGERTVEKDLRFARAVLRARLDPA